MKLKYLKFSIYCLLIFFFCVSCTPTRTTTITISENGVATVEGSKLEDSQKLFIALPSDEEVLKLPLTFKLSLSSVLICELVRPNNGSKKLILICISKDGRLSVLKLVLYLKNIRGGLNIYKLAPIEEAEPLKDYNV